MSHNANWDVNKYRQEHENQEQWQLRKAFLLKWKDEYPEERLVCLAQVFTNMEFMGCRYPSEVMHEVARLSADIAKNYRNNKKTKLQRTFVSASDAAEDRARGVKRAGGVIVEAPEKKRIAFVPQGQNHETDNIENESCVNKLLERMQGSQNKLQNTPKELLQPKSVDSVTSSDVKEINGNLESKKIIYMEDIMKMDCLDPRDFSADMFNTPYGKLVLVIRPWSDMISNLTSTCASLKVPFTQEYRSGRFTIHLNNGVLVSVTGDKTTAKAEASRLAWEKLRQCSVILLIKEQWVQQDDRVSLGDMSHKGHEFGEPIEESVAMKMMKLMGWKGGGLGADSQGIAEPIKPKLRMIRRAGLGHETGTQGQLKRAGLELMRRRGVTLDADLVFAADFTADERAILHQCANQCGLNSKSYGKGEDRFLVVSHKLRPFALVQSVLECGGETPKYRVFIPATIGGGSTWAKRTRR